MASDVTRTKILLLGLRRSGKSSIVQTLFHNLPPKQTFYLEPTLRIEKITYDTVIPLEIWDCPGNITLESLKPLAQFRTIIFVIDIRDILKQAIAKLVDFVITIHDQNPGAHFEIFVHKVERLQEDDKLESFRQIEARVSDSLFEHSSDFTQLPFAAQMTSVYDHSLHRAFSKVLLKLVGLLPYLEELLNVFCSNSQSPKAFLFDVQSRLYIATDASPVDDATHDLCSDYLRMLNAFGPLYKYVILQHTFVLGAQLFEARHKTIEPTSPSAASEEADGRPATRRRRKELFYPSGAALLHSSAPGTTLTYHLITEHLALLAVIPTAVFESRRGLIEYNVVHFREGVQEIYEVEQQVRGGS
ncbi:Gtr1/RagA G protein Gtr2 [Cylindrobasidium torrendii FP15055 ss-10]|uniref:GTP-binding protein n=1 Tax=Cylindrobasidium torrendii FP15055 ss-10 TaxID=1314674 RepID=A0A0D7BG86_9AGAR|nr:Gtr1/RagA G protein Gtr2 [Cylindrobasidium torrendii FP15055 ss-10]